MEHTTMTPIRVKRFRFYMENFETEGEYVKNRLAHLKISHNSDLTRFSMGTRGGFTRPACRLEGRNVTQRSFLLERRLFKLELVNYKHAATKLTDNFKAAVNGLPRNFDVKSKRIRTEYEQFFNLWGHCIIKSAYCGGSVEGKVEINLNTSDIDVFGIRNQIRDTFRDLTKKDSHPSQSLPDTSRLEWVGGDDRHQVNFIRNISSRGWKLWQASLSSHPAILTHEMSLLPIHHVVGLADPTKENGCRKAMNYFLEGKFTAPKEQDEGKASSDEQTNQDQSNQGDGKPKDPATDGSCYAGSSMVYLQDMTAKTIADVNIGDSLLVSAKGGTLQFSKVFMINHRNHDAIQEFCQIFYDQDKNPLNITTNHIVMVNGSARFAGDVKIGDTLSVFDKTSKCLELKLVQKIEKITLRGFHAPITMDGKLVVDDILTSCYCEVPEKVVFGRKLNGHQLAHMGMAPFRMMRKMNVGTKTLEIKKGNEMPQAIQWAIKRVLPCVLN